MKPLCPACWDFTMVVGRREQTIPGLDVEKVMHIVDWYLKCEQCGLELRGSTEVPVRPGATVWRFFGTHLHAFRVGQDHAACKPIPLRQTTPGGSGPLCPACVEEAYGS